MADLLIRCHKWDLALSLELTADLTVQRPLVGLDGQEVVGPPAPGGDEKRLLGVESIGLDQNALKIQLGAYQERSPLGALSSAPYELYSKSLVTGFDFVKSQ
jgi:hypothetical protein